VDLVEPVLRALPELRGLALHDEPLATCARCAMAPRRHTPHGEVVFTAPARCCTYHPTLANWLVGRALRRDDAGTERILARLQDPDGVSALGIAPGPTRARAWRTRSDDAYGRDEPLTCPYWTDQGLGCTIHRDRDAVCRTWFCKVGRGERGAAVWGALKALLATFERELADVCVQDLPEPSGPWAPWFVACADHVDGLGDDALRARLPSSRLHAMRDALTQAIARRDAPLPDVVQPRVRDWVVREGEVALSSFSPYDRTPLPPWIFALLSRLDGERTWREAVDLASTDLGHPVPGDLVMWLWDRGLLGPPIDVHGSDLPVLQALPGD
jgi:hypothetical protein